MIDKRNIRNWIVGVLYLNLNSKKGVYFWKRKKKKRRNEKEKK